MGLGAAPTAGPALASTARASAGSAAGAKVPVIVFLKSQPEASGVSRARSEKNALIQAAQAPYLQQLRQLDATSVKSYRLVNAFTVDAGQTRTIPVTITPSGAAGTVVRGALYVDDFVDSMQFLSGSQLMALPYSYTIG